MSSPSEANIGQPPPSAPPQEEKKCVNSEVWHACAGPLVCLPTVGTRVVYFPQGHSEQVAALTNKVDRDIPNYPSLPPQLICQLHDVTMHADVETDEVYAQMMLQPLNPQEQNDVYLPAEMGIMSKQPTNYFCKTLTAIDTSTYAGFSVPRRAAERVFPPLDSEQPTAQGIVARDIHDVEWKFRHIFGGQPKRHLLTIGWSMFVSAKRLVAGDSVLFIRNEKNQLFLGIRRANRPKAVMMSSSVLSSDSIQIGLLAAAAHAAATNGQFTIFYNPRASPSEFVIPLSKYIKAVFHTQISVGMRFRMLFETEECSVSRYMGTITEVSDADPVRWPSSYWRSVKVGWDESIAGERPHRVSLWEIDLLMSPLQVKHPYSGVAGFHACIGSWRQKRLRPSLLSMEHDQSEAVMAAAAASQSRGQKFMGSQLMPSGGLVSPNSPTSKDGSVEKKICHDVQNQSLFCSQVDSSSLLHNMDTGENDQTTGKFIIVFKSGSVGRCLEITRFSSYGELREELGQMFGIKGQLDDPYKSGWQLVYFDKKNRTLLLGDDPWESFVNSVWYIKILSPEDVHKMDPRFLSRFNESVVSEQHQHHQQVWEQNFLGLQSMPFGGSVSPHSLSRKDDSVENKFGCSVQNQFPFYPQADFSSRLFNMVPNLKSNVADNNKSRVTSVSRLGACNVNFTSLLAGTLLQIREPHHTCQGIPQLYGGRPSAVGFPHYAGSGEGKISARPFPHKCAEAGARIPQLYGRDKIRKMITEDILLSRNGGNNCSVVCICAESGLGKTALLRVLYSDQQLLCAFDMRIWIQLSDKFDSETLFRKTIEFVTHVRCGINNLSLLEEMVKEVLADKKILFFLDDADIEDEHFWASVLKVLSAGSKDSVIVIATRSHTVAALAGEASHCYSLDFLSEENNLMLLQHHAHEGNDIKSNPGLISLSETFIAKFGANPQHLMALCGLLCHKDTSLLELEKLEGNMLPCLQFCHDILPKHLKDCLAFCSLFPKGYIFDRHHTVLLWISQGFVAPVEGHELEDIGVEYFNELLCRSFFQYSPVHEYKDNKFVMHELVYDVVMSASRDKYFRYEDILSSIPANTIQLSLVSSRYKTVQLMSIAEELKDLQTFLVVRPEWQQYDISVPIFNLVCLHSFFLRFTSLETLDLSHTDIEELPRSIGGLRNLQFLSLNSTCIRTLPCELCSLSNLQMLEAKDCRYLTELPEDIKNLIKLRHLNVMKELGYVCMPRGVGQLTDLQTLPVFHASSDSSYSSIRELGNLRGLRGCLQLEGLESIKTGSIAQDANLKDKEHLQELTLQWDDDGLHTDVQDEEAENVAIQVLESLQPHANLRELSIRGYEGSEFPAWMQGSSCLHCLVSLTLDSCYNCSQLPTLALMSSLKFLSIRKMYDVQRLSGDINGAIKFLSLEQLNLWEMYGLEELLEVSEGDCPKLRKICISRCPDLKRLPCTPSVEELVLHSCDQLPDLPELPSLMSLRIEGFHSVKSFNLPQALPVLKKLEISSCRELSFVHGVSTLTTIQRLKIAGCPKLVLTGTDC